NGCDVNSQSYSGNTALHIACGRGQVDTVRLLLKSGADSSLKNYHNDTPITDVLRGRASKQVRLQELPLVSVSPHQSCYMENGENILNEFKHLCTVIKIPQFLIFTYSSSFRIPFFEPQSWIFTTDDATQPTS
ncbi:hypothetical protein GOODEAATRI_020232, partial [Goodea atripinnis]